MADNTQPTSLAPPVESTDRVMVVQRRAVRIANQVSIRLQRAMYDLEKADPGGKKLPKDPEFLKHARWLSRFLTEIEGTRIQREKLRRSHKDPVGTPEDDFQHLKEASRALPPEKLALLMEDARRVMEERRAEQEALGEGPALLVTD